MQVIIPMSGKGQRFIKKGYKTPKPLIFVDGKPIIHHVIDLFPSETNFKFICNKEHVKLHKAKEIIQEYCPTAHVIDIESHKKGPVYAVTKILDCIDDKQPAIINYCDFSCYWDYFNFKKYVFNKNLDGCIPAYRGFHPHSLGSTNYAYLRESKNKLIEIKEKEPYTKNRMLEFASSGTYYFSKGEFIKYYFQEAIHQNLNTNGEFYCSLIYNLMVKDKLNVGIYELEHFMQWGTPEDLEEYKNWSNIFKLSNSKIGRSKIELGTTLMPIAGKGSRFKKEGYKKEKPLIEINQIPMFIRAKSLLPRSIKNIFVVKEEISQIIDSSLKANLKDENNLILNLNHTLEGQALTTSKAIVDCIKSNSINISACDHGVFYDDRKFEKLIESNSYDIIIWSKKDYVPAINNPEMYGWISYEGNNISKVFVKRKPQDFNNKAVIIGTFTFRNTEIFNHCLDSLIRRKGKINGEYYIDSLIQDALELGYRCKSFEVDHYICWGTPNELKTFLYWENCFNKWSSHPYSRRKSIWSKN